ncbi:hypothetical protein BHM03_00042487, partial [Ensete ventricosum]
PWSWVATPIGNCPLPPSCPCKGPSRRWPPLQAILATTDRPYRWNGHGWLPMQGAYPQVAAPFLTIFPAKMQQERVE